MGEVKLVHVNIAERLSAEEWTTIDAFKARADRLSATRLATDATATAISANITIDAKGLSTAVKLPGEADLAQHLMALRHFFLQGEPSFMPHVLKVLGKHMPGEQERKALGWFNDQWKLPLFAGAVMVKLNGVQLTPARIFDLWCNGEYFHADAQKAADLATLWDHITEPFAKYALVDSMYHWSKLVFRLRHGMEDLRRPG